MGKVANWDLEGLLFERVAKSLAERYGVVASRSVFDGILRTLLAGEAYLVRDGLVAPTGRVDRDNLVTWFVQRICNTEDGIVEVLEGQSSAPGGSTSPLYHAILETLHTARGHSFTTEQVAQRLHYNLGPRRARRLRQLRRMLERVVKDSGGRIRRPNKTTTLFQL